MPLIEILLKLQKNFREGFCFFIFLQRLGREEVETFFFGIRKGFLWVMELVAIFFIVVVLDVFILHAPCSLRAFMAIQAGFAVVIILADRIDSMEGCLCAWTAGYFLAFLVVGTRWFQGG